MTITILEAILVLGILAFVVAAIVIPLALLLRKLGEGSSTGSPADEVRLMQEIHHGLEQMEQRVEALETILMDRSGEAERERKDG